MPSSLAEGLFPFAKKPGDSFSAVQARTSVATSARNVPSWGTMGPPPPLFVVFSLVTMRGFGRPSLSHDLPETLFFSSFHAFSPSVVPKGMRNIPLTSVLIPFL